MAGSQAPPLCPPCSLHAPGSDEYLAYISNILSRRHTASSAPPATVAAGGAARGASAEQALHSSSSGLAPQMSGAASGASSGALPDGMQRWEVQWSDIQLIRQLGRGSFGRVYLARWLHVDVAVKVGVAWGGQAPSGTARRVGKRGQCEPTLCAQVLVNDAALEQDALELPSTTMKQLIKVLHLPARETHVPAGGTPAPGWQRAAKFAPAAILVRQLQECSLMASLRHPGICNFIGLCAFPPCVLTGAETWAMPGAAHDRAILPAAPSAVLGLVPSQPAVDPACVERSHPVSRCRILRARLTV